MNKDGLFFYPLAGDDLTELYNLFTDDSVAFHFAAPRTNNQFIGTEELLGGVASWIKERQDDFAANRGAYFAVQKKGKLVALAGLAIQEEYFRSGRILLAVTGDNQGRGIGRAIVTALSTWAINEIGLARLELSTPGHNQAVRALALTSGFAEEGDHCFVRLSPANQLIGANRKKAELH